MRTNEEHKITRRLDEISGGLAALESVFETDDDRPIILEIDKAIQLQALVACLRRKTLKVQLALGDIAIHGNLV